MQVDIDQVSATERTIRFQIPAETVSSEIESAYRELQTQVRLPGFRKGKAPRQVLENRFGRRVCADVANHLINDSFREATKDLVFFGKPEVESGEVESGQPFLFSVTLEVKPEIELKSYTGIKVSQEAVEVSEEEVEHAIEHQLQSQASVAEVEEDREISETDMVMVEIRIEADGELLHEHPGTTINLASEAYYPGIETLITGAKKDQAVEGQVTFGDSIGIPEISGRSADVTAKILSIQAIQIPELSDEVAEQLNFEGGAEGMRQTIRDQARAYQEENARNKARASLLEVLIEANPFEVPKSMVEQQMESLKNEMRMQALYQGRDPRHMEFSEEEVQLLHERALFASRSALVLEYVTRKENIEVNDADMEARYTEIAEARGQRVEAIRAYFQKENATGELRARLLEEKTLNWLMEHASIQKA